VQICVPILLKFWNENHRKWKVIYFRLERYGTKKIFHEIMPALLSLDPGTILKSKARHGRWPSCEGMEEGRMKETGMCGVV
jgi:hypothetical protein